MRRLITILLISAVCLLGIFPVLAQGIPISQYTTLEEYEKLTGKKIEKFDEAPILRTKVAAGELPPVEQRLPEEPVVINPVEEIGQYGGTWRQVTLGQHELIGHASNWFRYEGLIRATPDCNSIVPNIAKSWDISDDGKVFTFHLRKGIKWSDGVPFTADDIMFWYENETLNKEITPVFPSWLTTMKVPGELEKIDDYTVRFVFSKPAGRFLRYLASSRRPYAPKHYMKKFHPKYTPIEKLEKMAKEAGFDHWYQLYQDKSDLQSWTNPEKPILDAWVVVTPYGAGTQVILERNPYYWKVDTAGNQLPYIDKVVISVIAKVELGVMKAISGEIDVQASPVGDNMSNYPMFMENREKGHYRIQMLPDGWNDIAYYFNFTHKDSVLRKIFTDKKFRIAMSYAIDRQEMMNILFPGWDMDIAQVSPPLDSSFYNEQLAKQYTEHDPQKANQLLDEIGLDKRSADGWRLRSDGKILTFTMEVPTFTELWINMSEFIIGYWQKVGIKASVKPEDPGLWVTRCQQSGEHDGTFAGSGGAERPMQIHYYVPLIQAWGPNLAAPAWGLWHQTYGKSGEEPPSEVKKAMELCDEIEVTVDEKRQAELTREVLKMVADNFWVGAIARRKGKMLVINKDVRNVPEYMFASAEWGSAGPSNPCQYFFKR